MVSSYTLFFMTPLPPRSTRTDPLCPYTTLVRSSQEQVATRLGITAPAFSKIECGFTDSNYSRLKQISDLFSLSVVELITYHNQEEQRKYQSELQDRKCTRLNSSHYCAYRMPSSA